MNPGPIIAELNRRFTGKTITQIPPDSDSPTKIIVEFERTKKPDRSVALAVIERSEPHYHRHTQETYFVERGHLRLHIEGATEDLYKGDELTILPDDTHWAEAIGEPAWVLVTATPAWREDDHILV